MHGEALVLRWASRFETQNSPHHLPCGPRVEEGRWREREKKKNREAPEVLGLSVLAEAQAETALNLRE